MTHLQYEAKARSAALSNRGVCAPAVKCRCASDPAGNGRDRMPGRGVRVAVRNLREATTRVVASPKQAGHGVVRIEAHALAARR